MAVTADLEELANVSVVGTFVTGADGKEGTA